MRRLALVSLAVLALAACSDGATKPPAATPSTATRSVQIVSPANGTTVGGNVVELKVAATGLTIVKADGNTAGATGHFHVFIDKNPVAVGAGIPREPGVVHFATDTVKLTGLSIGKHHLAVVLGDGAHTRLDAPAAEIDVTTTGPSVHAGFTPSAPVAGQPLTLTVAAEGFTVVKADGDSTGKTGHFHVVIDHDPVAGELFPMDGSVIHSAATTITVPALSAGEHNVWVVVGDGTHHALSPLVAARNTITVLPAASPPT